MKNSIKILATLALVGLAGTASAQEQASTDGTSNATVIQPIAISATHSLDFGTVIGGLGDVTESNGNNAYGNVNNQYTGTNAGTPADATFAVTGEPGMAYNITRTAPTGDLTVSSGTNSMTITLDSDPLNGTLDGTGNDSWSVGGVLHVGAGQASGTYTNAASSWVEQVQYQ